MALASASSLALTTLHPISSRPHNPPSHSPSYLPSSAQPSGTGIAPLRAPHELTDPAVLKWRTRVSFFPSFPTKKGKSKDALKEELLDAIGPLDRGAEASPDDQQRVDQIARELEAINSIKEPLKSDLLNGKWELLYTTSRSILQSQRPKFLRPNGKIYQAINVDTLRAQNMETWPYFNQIPIKATGSGSGELEITYLDEEIRSRWREREIHLQKRSLSTNGEGSVSRKERGFQGQQGKLVRFENARSLIQSPRLAATFSLLGLAKKDALLENVGVVFHN